MFVHSSLRVGRVSVVIFKVKHVNLVAGTYETHSPPQMDADNAI
jgi:hypothetical protein